MFIWYLFPYVIRIPGLILGILIGWQVVRRIVRRGYLLFGLATGLFIVFLIFITIQYSLVLFYRSSFSQTGPCGICGEWTYVPFSLLWLNSALMLASGTVTSIIAIWKTPPEVRDFSWRWPKWFPRLLIGLLAIIAVAVIAVLLFFRQQQAILVTELGKVSHPIEGLDMMLIGRTPLSGTYPPGLLDTSPPHPESNGLQFSPTGQWFSIRYDNKIEIWDRNTLHTEFVLTRDDPYWYPYSIFSPDGKLLAIWIHETSETANEFGYAVAPRIVRHLTIYSTDSLTKLWDRYQTDIDTDVFFFSADGSELIQIRQEDMLRLDANAGTELGQLPKPNSNLNNFDISLKGNYIALRSEDKVNVYSKASGLHIKTIDLPPEMAGSETVPYFLPNGNMFLYNFRSGNHSAVINLETGDIILTETPDRSAIMPQIVFSSNSSFVFISRQTKVDVIDLSSGKLAGTLSLPAAATAMAFSPDQTLFVVATADGNLNFYGANEATP